MFFVTGLSAGFGYNRSLELPAQDKVQEFPLLAGLSDPSKIGGADATPEQALDKLNEYVPPAQGVNWVAAGVQFTSFELINSNALLVVEFGRDFEIALLGLSRIKLPPVGDLTFAYVELALEVIFQPTEGVFSATAVLTPNSYVLDPALPPDRWIRVLHMVRQQRTCRRLRAHGRRLWPVLRQTGVVPDRAPTRIQLGSEQRRHDQGWRLLCADTLVRHGRRLPRHRVCCGTGQGLVHGPRGLLDPVAALLLHRLDRGQYRRRDQGRHLVHQGHDQARARR